MDGHVSEDAPRRSLLGRLIGAMAMGLTAVPALAAAATEEGPDWPGKLPGRHRQVCDAFAINDGRALIYTHNFLSTTAPPGSATAVLVLRGPAVALAANDTVWDRYKLGETMKIVDPATKATAVKNPYLHPPSGALPLDEAAIDRLVAAGVVFGVCNMALHGVSKVHAAAGGATAEVAYKDWTGNLIAGMTVIPSGVWGLNRAQEAGCTYCVGA